MQDTTALRAHLAVAAARVVEDLEADGLTVDQVEITDVADRLLAQLDDFATILGAITGRGRTAAGDALADRLWGELGIEARL